MTITTNKNAVVLFLSLLMMSCVSGLSEGNKPVEPEIISEIVTTGASLSTFSGAFPDTVFASLRDGEPPSVDAGDLSMKFWHEYSSQHNKNAGAFYFSFSRLNGAEYELLNNQFLNNNGDRENFYIELYGIEARNGLQDIIGDDDFYTEAAPVFIPIDATHVELRFVSLDNTAYVVLERYALDTFKAYNKYIKPIVDNYNQ